MTILSACFLTSCLILFFFHFFIPNASQGGGVMIVDSLRRLVAEQLSKDAAIYFQENKFH